MRDRQSDRRGIAVVEAAAVLPVLLILMLGVWEFGRAIQVQQVMANAAREGARIAAQGQTINLQGAFTQIRFATGTPNVKQTIADYLRGAGIVNLAGMNVTFQFLDGDMSKTEPFQATKGQKYAVSVSLPYDTVRISGIDLLPLTTLTARVEWVSMVDDPFTFNSTLPTWNPLP